MVGVGGVVIRDGRALLIRRGSEPLRGEWSIPGGMLEVGETLVEGVARELLEETGLQVKVLDLIEVFERIFTSEEAPPVTSGASREVAAEAAVAGESPKRGAAPSVVNCAGVDFGSKAPESQAAPDSSPKRPLYHFVILDYLCEAPKGTPRPGGDVTDVAFASESELPQYRLTPTATRVIQKAFALAREK
jgi:ADP-ribose pyrophosphatase YjhB (NUDIX family)